MKLSAWITTFFLCTLIRSNPVQGADINVLYGHNDSLKCGDESDFDHGHWYHNGNPTEVRNYSFPITNADFNMSGQYQCMKGGQGVFSSPLEVVVYGYQNISPRHCDSIEDNVCVKNVSRGQTVTFCVDFPTVPLVISQGKPTAMVRHLYWAVGKSIVFSCENRRCSESLIDGKKANTSCMRIPNVTQNQLYHVHTYVGADQHYIGLLLRLNVIGSATTSSSVTPSATSSTKSSSPSATVPSIGSISDIPRSATTSSSVTPSTPSSTESPSPSATVPTTVLISNTASTLSSEEIVAIVAVFIIVFVIIAVAGVGTFLICRKKRFSSREPYVCVKPHSSKLSLQSPNVVSPSKSENGLGNHNHRPDKLTVLHQGVTVGNGTPGANSLQPLISPGSSLMYGTSPSNGTHPQYPPPDYSAIMSAQEAKSRENLSLNLGNTNQEQNYHGNNSDDVDDGDFGAGPLEEAQDIQICPNK